MLFLATAGWSALAAAAESTPVAPGKGNAAGIEFFEAKIRPVLVESCFKCHSTQEGKKPKSGFSVESLAALTAGGNSGSPGVVVGDPDKSLLIRSIRYTQTDESLNMPPDRESGGGGKLPDAVVHDFETWVKMGAPVPPGFASAASDGKAAASPRSASQHWAFVPPQLPPVPAVDRTAINVAAASTGAGASTVEDPVNAIDHFVRQGLAAKSLQPSPPADRRTLIRRATFDLLGIPPTPQEVAAFEADTATDAYGRLIDRLLADPRYGERWGRHWLDVARYADSKGYVFMEERRYPYAYTYRDYVIRAFNEDKPYDRFVREQLAADQLDLHGDNRSLSAMGFLTLGRRFLKNEDDIIDDRIDVVTRGLMGLTVTCARCHDHKFDPVPTSDYYSLHGVFASSVEPVEGPLVDPSDTGTPGFREELDKRRAAVEAVYDGYRKQLFADYHTPENLADKLLLALSPADSAKASEAAAAKAADAAADAKPGDAKPGDAKTAANDKQRAAQISHSAEDLVRKALRPGQPVAEAVFGPLRRLVAMDASALKDDPEAALAAAFKAKPAANPVVRAAFEEARPTSSKEAALALAKVLLQHDREETFSTPADEQIRSFMRGAQSPFTLSNAELGRMAPRDIRNKIRDADKKVQEWQVSSPESPARAMVLNDREAPHNSAILIRGNPGNRGVEVPRQPPAVVAGKDRKAFSHGSGRLELADAIVSPSNPLTARVLVNRVWGWHFGKGIVTTPSDFGMRSDPPSNPQLLDWLAVTFMNDGWSVKQMHRLIMLSATYRQASDDRPAASAIDSENRLLWRQNIQRMDFETMRDSLLAVAGQLNAQQFGRPVELASPDETRRSIYGFIDRQNLSGMFRAFDFATPDTHAPQRFQTTVPQQALFFLNSPFAQNRARALAARADVAAGADTATRVNTLYGVLFNRAATRDELQLAERFLQTDAQATASSSASDESPGKAWQYGYGRVDADAVRFLPFTVAAKKTWQGGKKLPDPKTGFASLDANGGHPGDADHATIRRFVAPVSGRLHIEGKLSHKEQQGDGVVGRIIVAGRTSGGRWEAHHQDVSTTVDAVTVAAGDTVDFVIECGKTVDFDSFGWAVRLSLTPTDHASTTSGESGDRIFDSVGDFSLADAPPPAVKLSPWERYVQVLLCSNEFFFVD